MKNNSYASKVKAFAQNAAPIISKLKYGEHDEEFFVKVYPVLPFTKRMEMIREIINGVFMDEKDSVSTYVPEFLALLQKYTVIKFYTNLPLPNDLNDMWLVLNYTTIYNDVVNIVGEKEINEIYDAANKAIDTYRQYLTTKTDINSLMNKIGGALSDFERKIPKEDITAITSKIKDLQKSSSIQDIVGSLLGNQG